MAQFVRYALRRVPYCVAATSVAHLGFAEQKEAYSWGSSQFGQVGHGVETLAGIEKPTRIEALDEVEQLTTSSCGDSSAALSDGHVYTFGCGRDARLGFGTSSVQNELMPRHLDILPEASAVYVGEYHGIAVTGPERNIIFGWGKRASGHDSRYGFPREIIVLPAAVKTAACGREHTLVVTETGKVWSWGHGSSFATGHGDKYDSRTPKQVDRLDGIVAVAAGREHSLFLRQDGVVLACGTDTYGQCGTGGYSSSTQFPTRVKDLEGKRIVAIAAGEYHSIAVDEKGHVWTWGLGRDGALGHGDRSDTVTPRHLLAATKLKGRVVQAAGGGGHTLLLTDKGVVYACGRGRSGQLGQTVLGSSVGYKTTPVEVTSLADKHVVHVAAGKDHSLALVE